MNLRVPTVFIGTTMLLWFVPSIGTQGMGTIGARVAHADAALFDADAPHRVAARALLARADRTVEVAVSR